MSTPSSLSGVPFAIHGVQCELPQTWDVVGTYGGWNKGHILAAKDRQPQLQLGWERSSITPDVQRTLISLGKRMLREHGCTRLLHSRTIGAYMLGTWESPLGEFHAAVRHFPEAKLTLTARLLSPIAASTLNAIISGSQAWGDDDGVPWQFHGLDIQLPPRWRLEGIHHLSGLVRAVWFHRDDRGHSDQVLVLRRYALATRLLAPLVTPLVTATDKNSSDALQAWLRTGLDRRDCVEHASSDDSSGNSVAHLVCTRPAAGWWRRLRQQREQRYYHAWVDHDADRLFLQENAGRGQPLPCLRTTRLQPA